MPTPLAALFVLKLKDFDNSALAALNNAIQGFGRLAPSNTAFTKALEAGLIDENGKPVELQSLIDASSFEVNRRITAGTFN